MKNFQRIVDLRGKSGLIGDATESFPGEMKKPLPQKAKTMRSSAAGFSLIELLCVIAVMAIAGGLCVVALPGFRSSSDRKHAVSQVTGTLERARAAALQAGENVYVIFARPTDGSLASDAMIVVGEPPLGSASNGKIFYTPWISLPRGVRFRGLDNLVNGGGLPSEIDPAILPVLSGKPVFSCMTFNSTGQVGFPVGNDLRVALFEGTREGNDRLTGASKAKELYDVVRVARYSGRSWVNVETLQDK